MKTISSTSFKFDEWKSNINHISNINTLKLIWNAFILLWIMEQFLGGNSSNSA